MTPAHLLDLTDRAEARWTRIVADEPQLRPAVTLQRALIGRSLQLAASLVRHGIPRLSLPPRYLSAKLKRGVAAFRGEPIPLPLALLSPAVAGFCDDLRGSGAQEATDLLREALESGRINVGALLTASLARDQRLVGVGAAQAGVSADLLWLVAELAVAPVAYFLQRTLLSGASPDTRPGGSAAEAVAAWDRGYCPACGAWPVFKEVDAEGGAKLRCAFCTAGWGLLAHRCVYCGAAGERLTLTTPSPERPTRRLELCDRCHGYLKVLDTPPADFALVMIEDLASMELDMAAIERGYGRPPLPELAPHLRR